MNIGRGIVPALASVLLLGACADGDRGESHQDSDSSAEAMTEMEGMSMMQSGSGDMMAAMRAHMEMMRDMSGDSMHSTLATHRQMMANMIAQMNREMSEMNMPADAGWTATMDSLRDDLVTMPDLAAAELQALMPEHHRRAMRLMEMHADMMAAMQM